MAEVNKYQFAKIYKIISPSHPELVYYGATIQSLNDRWKIHKWEAKNRKNCKSYLVIEKGDAEIKLIENFLCNSKEDLNAREAFYIRNNDCVNKLIPDITKEEAKENDKKTKKKYYEENKEIVKEYGKKYREEHKETIKEYSKKYRDEKKENLKEYNKKYYEEKKENLKEYNKKYYEENKETIKEQKKKYMEKYYDEKKEEIAEKKRAKYTCICGVETRKDNKAKHQRSKLHQNYILSIKENEPKSPSSNRSPSSSTSSTLSSLSSD